MASISEPFIRRPVGTTLLAIGIFLVGVVAYHFLPVASMPTIEYPTISVTANRPGADPETMAAMVSSRWWRVFSATGPGSGRRNAEAT